MININDVFYFEIQTARKAEFILQFPANRT